MLNIKCSFNFLLPKIKFNLTVQSVPITTKGVSSNPARSEVFSIQHYVINIISDLR
jgi:hypothetical protein